MIELPEANVLAQQIQHSLAGKVILSVTAAQSPHKFAWYHGDPSLYAELLKGKTVQTAYAYGGLVEVVAEDTRIVFGDGIALSHLSPDQNRPGKHQLLVEFDDGSALMASVRMYGGMWAFRDGDFDNPHYHIARERVSPLEAGFTWEYFAALAEEAGKLSVKAFLATEQRIPGLGNGVLQDILYSAGIHPKRKLLSLSEKELRNLFQAVKSTLKEMTAQGGRDTEKDLFGAPGGYKTIMSKNNNGKPCPGCGTAICKEAYMGGSIYYCPHCQQLPESN